MAVMDFLTKQIDKAVIANKKDQAKTVVPRPEPRVVTPTPEKSVSTPAPTSKPVSSGPLATSLKDQLPSGSFLGMALGTAFPGQTLSGVQNIIDQSAKGNSNIIQSSLKPTSLNGVSSAQMKEDQDRAKMLKALSPVSSKLPSQVKDPLLGVATVPGFIAKDVLLGGAIMVTDLVNKTQQNIANYLGTDPEGKLQQTPFRDLLQAAYDEIGKVNQGLLSQAKNQDLAAIGAGTGQILSLIGAAYINPASIPTMLRGMAVGQASGVYQDTLAATGDETKSLLTALPVGVASYYLNKLGFESIMGKVWGKQITNKLANLVIGGATEALTETTEQLATEVAQKISYKKKLSTLKDYWKTAWISGTVGLIGSGISTAQTIRQDNITIKELEKQGMEPEEARDLLDRFKQYSDRYVRDMFDTINGTKEQRLIGLKGGKKGTSGIDYPAPLPEVSPQVVPPGTFDETLAREQVGKRGIEIAESLSQAQQEAAIKVESIQSQLSQFTPQDLRDFSELINTKNLSFASGDIDTMLKNPNTAKNTARMIEKYKESTGRTDITDAEAFDEISNLPKLKDLRVAQRELKQFEEKGGVKIKESRVVEGGKMTFKQAVRGRGEAFVKGFKEGKQTEGYKQKRIRVEAIQLQKRKGELQLLKQKIIERENIDNAKIAKDRKIYQIKQKELGINNIKQAIVSYAKNRLPKKERGGLLETVKNAKTVGALQKAIAKIDLTNEEFRKRDLRINIRKLLKSTKAKKVGGKPVGKFTPEIQKVLDILRTGVKMKPSEIEAKIADNLAPYKDTIPPDSVALENSVLGKIGNFYEQSFSKLDQFYEYIGKMIEEGKLARDLEKFNREADVDMWKDKAIDIITGGKGLKGGLNVTGKIDEPNAVIQVLRTLGKSQVGWNDILDMLSGLDKSSKPGESWLNKFGEVLDNENMEKEGVRKSVEKLKEMAADSFGVKTNKQLLKRLDKDSIEESLGVFKDSDGKMVELKMTKSEARKRWMELQDPSLRESFYTGMNYTQEIENAIDSFLNDSDKKFAQAQLDFYKEYYKTVNEVYKEIYGIELPFNEFYSPIRRIDMSRDSLNGFGEFLQEIVLRRSISSPSLISRVKNIKTITLQSDVKVLQQHVAEMEHFKAWVKKVKDLKDVFGSPEVRTAIAENYGKKMVAVVDEFLNKFAIGGKDVAQKIGWLDAARVRFVRSVLSLTPAQGIKQLVGMFNFADHVPIADFATGVIDFWSHPVKNTKTLMQSEWLKARGDNLDRDIKAAINSDAYVFFRKKPSFLNTLMINQVLGDRGSIVMGGWPVYRYYKNKFLKQGMSQGQAHVKALKEFEKAGKISQPSGDTAELSQMQQGGSMGKLLTMLQSGTNQAFRRELSAIRALATGRGSKIQNLKTIAIYHFLVPMLWQFFADGFEWDDDNQERAAVLGTLNGIFMVGSAFENLIQYAVSEGEQDFELTMPVLTPFTQDLPKIIKLLWDDDITNEDWLTALDGFVNATGKATGLPLKQAYNMGTGAKDLINGQDMAFMQALGWSPYILKKKQMKWETELLDEQELEDVKKIIKNKVDNGEMTEKEANSEWRSVKKRQKLLGITEKFKEQNLDKNDVKSRLNTMYRDDEVNKDDADFILGQF